MEWIIEPTEISEDTDEVVCYCNECTDFCASECYCSMSLTGAVEY